MKITLEQFLQEQRELLVRFEKWAREERADELQKPGTWLEDLTMFEGRSNMPLVEVEVRVHNKLRLTIVRTEPPVVFAEENGGCWRLEPPMPVVLATLASTDTTPMINWMADPKRHLR